LNIKNISQVKIRVQFNLRNKYINTTHQAHFLFKIISVHDTACVERNQRLPVLTTFAQKYVNMFKLLD